MKYTLIDWQNYKDEAQKQRKIIYQLEKERDRYINEASELTQKVLQHMEDVKVREMQIFDYKKKIAEAETKLKQQQVSLETRMNCQVCPDKVLKLLDTFWDFKWIFKGTWDFLKKFSCKNAVENSLKKLISLRELN